MTTESLFDENGVSDGTARAVPTPLSTPTAQQIMAEAMDHGNELGYMMPRKFKGHLAKEIGELHKEGIAPDLILAAAIYVIEQGLDPSVLSSTVVTVQANPRKAEHKDERDLIREFLEEKHVRWPTGSRWVRGTHSGTYIPDPLGVDRPDYEVPWDPPSRDELLKALKERDEDGEHFG